MIELSSVEWRNDRITRKYAEENREQLERPEAMEPFKLGEACTYCKTIENPYTYEIMRRSGHLEKYMETFDERERRRIFDKACSYHGMRVV